MLYNLREYHRPASIEEALRLLRRSSPKTVALAGGVSVIGQGSREIEAVVDLQDLGLGAITREPGLLRLGAMVRLQTIVEELPDALDGLLAVGARRMAGWNLRNQMTVGGVLAGGDVRSPLSVVLAALSARVEITDQEGDPPFWTVLSADLRRRPLAGRLITGVTLELPSPIGASYHQVGRTAADLPILCAAAAAYPHVQGGINVVLTLGGYTHDLYTVVSVIAATDAADEIESMAGQVLSAPHDTIREDYLGSAEYRRGVAPVLARRAVSEALARFASASGGRS
ncbi:MAG: xanthine dehydrogenase family protein subunit M [Anaerolineae bacterium]